MKNNGTKWDLSKSPEVVHAMIRDAFDIVAVVGVSAGAVVVLTLACALVSM
jgi:hypothetical protein